MPDISFEFFPPKSIPASFRLWETVQTLAPLDPRFVSVTYGAGGTTRKLTHEAVEAIGASTGLRVAAHLTCVDATKEETLEIARAYKARGISDIVALRGDPQGGRSFQETPGGFASSVELIEALSDLGGFNLTVGAYPDRHPDAASDTADIEYLKRKFDAGASSAITQFFFEADTFFRFRDACEKAGIDKPIMPGILPIEHWGKTLRFAKKCGAHVPAWLDDAFTKAERDERGDLLAIAVASELCSDLIDGGVEHLHFYTLNRPDLTREICAALGMVPKAPLAKVA